MFDLKRHKAFIAETFFKHFKYFNKPILTQKFVERWLSILSLYSKNPKFSCFDSPIPLIENLPLKPRAVLVISNKDTRPEYTLMHTTEFPLCLFRVYLTDGKIIYCKEGVEMLRMYLEITDIKLVGFHRVQNYKFVMECLNVLTDVKFYTPSLFRYFCRMTKGHNGSISHFQKTRYLFAKNENIRSCKSKQIRSNSFSGQ